MLPFAFINIFQIGVSSEGRLVGVATELGEAIQGVFSDVKTTMNPGGIVVLFRQRITDYNARPIDPQRVAALLKKPEVRIFLDGQRCVLAKRPKKTNSALQLINLLVPPHKRYLSVEDQGHLLAHFLVSIMPILTLRRLQPSKKKGRVLERGFIFGNELLIAIYVEPATIGWRGDIKHRFLALSSFVDHILDGDLLIEELRAVFAQVSTLESSLERLLKKPQLELPFRGRLAPEGTRAR